MPVFFIGIAISLAYQFGNLPSWLLLALPAVTLGYCVLNFCRLKPGQSVFKRPASNHPKRQKLALQILQRLP